MTIAVKERINYAVIAGLIVVMFWNASAVTWAKWFERDSYFSHGILIPFVSGYLIWRIRDELARLPVSSSHLGLGIFAFGLVCRLFGAYTRVNYITGFSFIIVLTGLVLFLFGRKITLRLLFPLLFLVWMVPLPDVTIQQLAFKLKMIVGDLTTRVLPYLGLSQIYRDGSVLHFIRPDGARDQLTIGDVCSGLRSMIALLAFGSVFAYITRSDARRRLELFAASIPCSVIANMCRIVVITLIAWLWGSDFATRDKVIPVGEGYTIHDATGILIFVVAFIGFFTYEKILNRLPFRLPRKTGPKNVILDINGRLVNLAENQLLCLIRAGHVSPNDAVRRKGEPAWRKASELVVFAQSPRKHMLMLPCSEKPVSFEECVRLARERKLRKDDFISYAGHSAKMRAGDLDFLRGHWPITLQRVALYAGLYILLPAAIFVAVWADHGFQPLGETIFSLTVISVVSWFFVRAAMLLLAMLLRCFQPAENPLPLPEAAQ